VNFDVADFAVRKFVPLWNVTCSIANPVNVAPLRKILPYTSILVAIAVLYTGYTFYFRKTASDQAAQRILVQNAESARENVDRGGGTALKITGFYVSPQAVRKGGTAKLCYGVVNATSISLDPPADRVWPSLSRCFDVRPVTTTTYTLTAQDAHGAKVTQSVDLAIQ